GGGGRRPRLWHGRLPREPDREGPTRLFQSRRSRPPPARRRGPGDRLVGLDGGVPLPRRRVLRGRGDQDRHRQGGGRRGRGGAVAGGQRRGGGGGGWR